jgi:hypothetical protein
MKTPPTYRIHPGIGIARLGNSPDSFYIGPQQRASLPIECDALGNPIYSPDGMTVQHVSTFKDSEGRIRRQAARFEVYVYDDQSPDGRPLKRGDRVEGGGNAGTLVDIQWRVWLANKKAVWYQFKQQEGEHGYLADHPLRNPTITDPNARQRLIIDPGPRSVDGMTRRRASFDRDGGENYSPTFPPPLQPQSIDTLGDLLTDNDGRLLVLGGHGHSGSFLSDEFGQPRIDDYANNDGWFDDTSDGPVMARLMMFSELVGQVRFVDVEYPAWVICGYPRYVPEILDIVTMEDVVDDLAITQFNERPDIYGISGTLDNPPPPIPPTDTGALIHWRAGRLRWNPSFKPWFYRDVWSILFRPDQFSYLCNILGQSNFPHNYSTRGTFDPYKLSVPPQVYWPGVRRCEDRCMRRHHEGELFLDTLAPAYMVLQKQIEQELKGKGESLPPGGVLNDEMGAEIQKALQQFGKAVGSEPKSGESFDEYIARWRTAAESGDAVNARSALEERVTDILDRLGSRLDVELRANLRRLTAEHLRKHLIGKLLDDCRATCVASNTDDPYRDDRLFLFSLLRKPGEENDFFLSRKASSRVHNLPLMPLLAGDNPISNVLPSKFLRLTEYQYYVLRQWATGNFFNEALEGWPVPNVWWPYEEKPVLTGRELDRGTLSNVLGGSFCPGAEVGWVMRNPAVWRAPYRLKADPGYYVFGQTGAQANQNHGRIPEIDYSNYTINDLSQQSNFDVGLQPGDLTKSMSVPWQADFNECSTQQIDITYDEWNQINPDAPVDALMTREQRVWETLWWPAHRPMQTNEMTSAGNLTWMDWTPGVPQTNAGDLKMVTEWWRLPFVIRNPAYDFTKTKPTTSPPPSPPPYISIERTKR